MNASAVVKGSECVERSVQIDRIPLKRVIQIFAPDRPDSSFDERVRHRSVRHRPDLPDVENPQVRVPSMKAEQRIVSRTDPNWRRMAGNGLIEHAAYRRAVGGFAADAEADDTAGENIDAHRDGRRQLYVSA